MLRSATLAVLAASLAAAEPAIRPGASYVEITTPHLRAMVPAEQATMLRPLLSEADAIYAAMAVQAGVHLVDRLDLLLSDSGDDHNGYSTVIPHPLVNVDLAPALPESMIFAGAGHLQRTLIHEFAHHLSNDRPNRGFRGFLERVFGRVLPFDPLSLLVFLGTTPNHVTMPAFWHEGLAQWAETTYAPAAGAWRGRGRDPLVHMIWRLDAAAGAIPSVGDWRLSYTRWPYGSEAYTYGLAYLRWLSAQGADPWQLATILSGNGLFSFDDGAPAELGSSHGALIARARAALAAEQAAMLTLLRTQTITGTTRLTPEDAMLGAPAWLPDGKVVLAYDAPTARPQQITVDAQGRRANAHRTAWSRGGVRALRDGTLVYAEVPGNDNPWARSRVVVVTSDGREQWLDRERLLQPDARRIGEHLEISAVELLNGGEQHLIVGEVNSSSQPEQWRSISCEGRAWSPTFRPGHDELCWVETDQDGSRLILAPLADPTQRTVLWQVPARLLHPAWNADGSALIVCSDVSGVANAYRIDPAQPGAATALTNVIGGIIACVPSPDGRTLAVIDHDRHGPYLALIPDAPAERPAAVPAIPASWPAPGPVPAPAPAALALVPAAALGEAHAYHGLARIRPLFWTPTLMPAPDGGYGVVAAFADPLATHQVIVGAGIGPQGYEPVGELSYVCATWPIDLALVGWQSERTYSNLLVGADLNDYDYVESVTNGQAAAGWHLAGLRRRWFTYVAVGAEGRHTSEDGEAEYAGVPILTAPAYTGVEHYLEAAFGYDDTTFFPLSYAPEAGVTGMVTARRGGFGGDLDRTRVLAEANAVLPIWPAGSHQLVLGGVAGINYGDRTMQGAFSVGGVLGLGLPRGYGSIVAVGDALVAGSAAYRLPLWQPMHGFGTTPWVHRQLVLEAFYDIGAISPEDPLVDEETFASAGGELHDEWEFWNLRLAPGVGVAKQLDAERDWTVYATLTFRE